MNELLAIVGIVVLCCVMFLAWLVTMAMCPDALVNLLSGNRSSSQYSTSSRESRELIRKSDSSVDVERGEKKADGVVTEDTDMVRSISAVLQLNGTARMIDKKLSVVDEVDEQVTLQSTIHSAGRPSILKHPVTHAVPEVHHQPSEL